MQSINGSDDLGIGVPEMLLTKPNEFSNKLSELNSLGIRIVLNDFGTGYSSLSYLRNYPISFIKIAPDFTRRIVDDINDKAIVDAIIEIGRSLLIRVIADGIFNEEQLSYLAGRSIEWMQGPHIDRSRDAGAVKEILRPT